MTGIVLLVVGIIGSIVDPIEDSKTESTASISADLSETTVLASTTTTSPKPEVKDLPVVSASSSPDQILLLQRLLNATCCSVAEDGAWGSETEAAVDQLRAFFELPLGQGLDSALWGVVLQLPPPAQFESTEVLEGLQIPDSAVFLDDHVAGLNPSAKARFILPFAADAEIVAKTVASWNGNSDVEGWRWCETYKTDERVLSKFWWQRSGRTLSLVVRDRGGGRVEISVMVEEGTDVSGCSGATPTMSDVGVIEDGSYRYRDEIAGWAWRPVARYRNDSDFTITFLRVRWYLRDGATLTGVYYDDVVRDPIAPGQTVEVMRGNWALLSAFDDSQSWIGQLLGSSALSLRSSVEYVEFDNGAYRFP